MIDNNVIEFFFFLNHCNRFIIYGFRTDEPIYIGAAPWSTDILSSEGLQMPTPVWTSSFRRGFIGCLKNFRVNGISANIALAYEEQKDNVSLGRHRFTTIVLEPLIQHIKNSLCY